MKDLFKEFKSDLPASIVVFFVALPLCLGIALASGAPLFSGIIAGIIGGIVVGAASGSSVGVSGPAAGLAVIVFSAITSLGSWEVFLTAVVLAGAFQLILGYAKAGFISYFFPNSVIKGMLTGIGLLIIIKQIPHALGWDKDPAGDLSFIQVDGETSISEIGKAVEFINPGAILITLVSMAILILWDVFLMKKSKFFQLLQGPIVVVIVGIFMNYAFTEGILNFSLSASQLVNIPVPESITGFLDQFSFPDWTALGNFEVWKTAIIIAIVASLETLLCVEATDKLDPNKRITPTNRELKAQGLGNMISGFIGGLPVTQVIVRSSTNIAFGGKSKMSTILHGIFLLISALTIGEFLNMIPLSSLAAILFMVGYKLAKPALFKQMYQLGWEQFMPFTATVIGILLTDLLMGIVIGIVFGIFFTLRHSYKNSYHLKTVTSLEGDHQLYQIELAQEVSFFNKASMRELFDSIPPNSNVIIDYSQSKAIAHDVIELIDDFQSKAKSKNIRVSKINQKVLTS